MNGRIRNIALIGALAFAGTLSLLSCSSSDPTSPSGTGSNPPGGGILGDRLEVGHRGRGCTGRIEIPGGARQCQCGHAERCAEPFEKSHDPPPSRDARRHCLETDAMESGIPLVSRPRVFEFLFQHRPAAVGRGLCFSL